MIRFKQFPPMTFVPREKFPSLNQLTPKGEATMIRLFATLFAFFALVG